MIQELMIINHAGLALFYHNFKSTEKFDDKQSLASYFDIICRFTKLNFKESLRTIALDSFIFFFYTHESRYHLVLKCVNRKFDKALLETLSERIIERFLEKYEVALKDFNGEISLFKSFSKEIEEELTSNTDEFKKLLTMEH